MSGSNNASLDKKFQNPDQNWVEVELYRHQHGHLPGEPGSTEKKLDIPEASRKMAIAISEGNVDPFNAAMAVAYLGKNFKQV